MLFDHDIALVTGASRGIGQAIAMDLGQLGVTVIGTATTDNGAKEISASYQAAGIKGLGMNLNVTEQRSIEKTLQEITEEFGAPTILINNAGITRDNLLMRMKDAEWNDIIETNLNSVFRMSKACLRAMVKAHYGRIISISSVVGATGNPGQVNYAAAKAGVIGFGKALAREVAARGITVNAVAPGFVPTALTEVLPEEMLKAAIANTPLGRLGTAEDVANAVLFLASAEAAFITGQVLTVDGGLVMQ